MHQLFHLLKTWKLPVAMIWGILLYFISLALPLTHQQLDGVYYVITHYIQPLLIFTMLTLSFVKVSPRNLRPHRWHGILLLTQGALFVFFALLALFSDRLSLSFVTPYELKLILEGAMLCFICPAATASVVIVQKLGGSMSGIVTYIILCNLMVAVLSPEFLTLVEPHEGMDFLTELFMIMGKVFPLLLCPLFLATIIRHYMPRVKAAMLCIPDLAFYLWLVALPLAITVTVRTMMENDISLFILLSLAVVSLISCVLMFWLGRAIGRRWPQSAHDLGPEDNNGTITTDSEICAVTGGQAFGQKNTVFVIWMGLVFLNPVTSVVGGFYSIWHNVINSWQLYKSEKRSLKKLKV